MDINENEVVDQIKPEIQALPVIVTIGGIVLPSRNEVFSAQRQMSINAANESTSKFNNYVLVTSQKKDIDEKNPFNVDDIYLIGTLCRVVNCQKVGKILRISVQGVERVKFIKPTFNALGNFVYSEYEKFPLISTDLNTETILVKKLANMISGSYNTDKSFLNFEEDRDFKLRLTNGMTASELCYRMLNIINVKQEIRQEIYSSADIKDFLYALINQFTLFLSDNDIENKINEMVRDSTNKQQKEYFLREKMKAIQTELGDDTRKIQDKITEQLEKNPYPQEVKDKVKDELKRLNTMPQGSLESSLIQDYITILMSVPWFEHTPDNDDVINAKKVLDEDHYGLKKVKERIVEYLAVKKMNGNLKSPILCFYGPPGCGKTSLSQSIARALGRKFIKCSLGGVSDEGEIRGHRRTYVGSRPGRIINLLRKVKVDNPVFLLDEIDKLSHDSFKGDPSSALLEVLDPEQNTNFNDNYLEVNYDLSNVLFICTANDLNTIPAPLMDRLELIEVESYTLIDKIHIAKDFLIKRELSNNGLKPEQVEFNDGAIAYIVEHYTMESGVRDLERKIASILRKVVVGLLNGKIKGKVTLTSEEVKKYLGIEDFDKTKKEKDPQIGVVTGLAWTPYGGDILPIEVNYFPGKGNLLLTGKLGDVMKESCQIALDYIKANSKKFNIDDKLFSENDIHVHVPEGAVSKDGPSAGCAITTAMVSAFTKRPVSGDIAMTGEVTLRGKALPIGGLREKSLAALRSGIKTIIVPKENKKNADELPKEVKDNLKIIYMTLVDEAIKFCLK
jgi:ATP-dependent Lon protease